MQYRKEINMSKQEQTELTPEIWSKVFDYMTGENAPNLFRGIRCSKR